MSSSLERIYPDNLDKNDTLGREALQLHLERYRFAGRHLSPGRIADAACGAGYGSYLLATEFASKVTGITSIDIDEDVIAYARRRYQHPLVEFLAADLLALKMQTGFDTIVSLETIEHLPDPRRFVEQMSALLTNGGRLIASAPVTPSVDANPYHLHDFNEQSFRQLFRSAGLREADSMLQVQRYRPFEFAGRSEGRSKDLRKGLMKYYLKNPGSLWRRLQSISQHGFSNKYLVVVYEKN
jgi:SAM-dependent methyltransferase